MELAVTKGFSELNLNEMMEVDGGEGIALAAGCIIVGVVGIVAGPPAAIAAVKLAKYCWYAGSTLTAIGGVVSCFE